MKILILGLGNPVMSDDGVGVRVVRLIAERYLLPREVVLLEGGTLGLELLPWIENAERLLVIDAVDSGLPPGTLVRLSGEEIGSPHEARLSPHQLGVKELLALAPLLGSAPQETVLWGVQPEALSMALELSDVVRAQLEPLTEMVLGELRRWGVEAGA